MTKNDFFTKNNGQFNFSRELNYSTLFEPYVLSPLNFDAFSFYDNNTSKG